MSVTRAWAEFFVKSVDCSSNSSEIQVDNALAVKMIVEGVDFNMGNTLSSSLDMIANNPESSFTLGHCNLITALCKAKNVPEYHSDIRFFSVKALTVGQFRGYDRVAGPPPTNEREEDEEMAEIDRYESGVHPDQQQQQERHAHPHSEDDIATLMTRLAIAENCNVPYIFYNDLATCHVVQLEDWDERYAAYQQQQFFTGEDLNLGGNDRGMSSKRDQGGSSLF
ncbi:hypothetical protein TSUD_402500 [Trifolium subterraneum]|uniref:Putative plant transposon protein domain-containing protein n=1 Tax=Trifolium subterraneum TaxID=3900 RepID=A0A2Z6NS98_TRISU|nr:hypothetical protein TSUD_402500 [Trifolium subterraneum]